MIYENLLLQEPLQLKAITADEFSKLKYGVYNYRIDDEPVHVKIEGRGQVRLVCIDLYPCSWNLKPGVIPVFEREWRRLMAAHGVKIGPRIHLPQGTTHLAFSVPKAAQGELLYLAAQLLSDKSNLVTILRPEWENAFASIKARRKEWMARTE